MTVGQRSVQIKDIGIEIHIASQFVPMDVNGNILSINWVETRRSSTHVYFTMTITPNAPGTTRIFIRRMGQIVFQSAVVRVVEEQSNTINTADYQTQKELI